MNTQLSNISEIFTIPSETNFGEELQKSITELQKGTESKLTLFNLKNSNSSKSSQTLESKMSNGPPPPPPLPPPSLLSKRSPAVKPLSFAEQLASKKLGKSKPLPSPSAKTKFSITSPSGSSSELSKRLKRAQTINNQDSPSISSSSPSQPTEDLKNRQNLPRQIPTPVRGMRSSTNAKVNHIKENQTSSSVSKETSINTQSSFPAPPLRSQTHQRSVSPVNTNNPLSTSTPPPSVNPSHSSSSVTSLSSSSIPNKPSPSPKIPPPQRDVSSQTTPPNLRQSKTSRTQAPIPPSVEPPVPPNIEEIELYDPNNPQDVTKYKVLKIPKPVLQKPISSAKKSSSKEISLPPTISETARIQFEELVSIQTELGEEDLEFYDDKKRKQLKEDFVFLRNMFGWKSDLLPVSDLSSVFVEKLSCQQKDIQQIFEGMEIESNGKISFSEFTQFVLGGLEV